LLQLDSVELNSSYNPIAQFLAFCYTVCSFARYNFKTHKHAGFSFHKEKITYQQLNNNMVTMDTTDQQQSKVQPFDFSSLVLHDEESLFDKRKKVIQVTWKSIEFGLNVEATKIFYDRLFQEFPSVRPMFKDDMNSQYEKLYRTVSLAVRFLDNVDELVPFLQDLGVRHGKYGVVRAHYEAVTECFLWTLNNYVRSHLPAGSGMAILWTFDVMDAWEFALTFIGTTMADAAEEATRQEIDEAEAKAFCSEESSTRETS
jgi:hemoglobin-like flavoprotein